MADETMQICAYVPAELVRALDDVATQKGLKRARAIERACEEYVKRETPFACPGCGTRVMALRHLKIPEREDNVALRKLSEIVTANNSEANFVVVGSHIDRAFSYLGVFVEDTFWTVRSFE